MKVEFSRAPWFEGNPSPTLLSLNDSLLGVWSECADTFSAQVIAARNRGHAGPKGMQKQLNGAITLRLEADGWSGSDGRFIKDRSWVRITFRHQMSLGSDFLEALRVYSLENAVECAIIAAPHSLLRLISPRDANVLCSYEKVEVMSQQLVGVLDTPLFTGRLTARSDVPPTIMDVLRQPRFPPPKEGTGLQS